MKLKLNKKERRTLALALAVAQDAYEGHPAAEEDGLMEAMFALEKKLLQTSIMST